MWKVESEWGYFASIRFRPPEPTVRAFHAECFHGSIVKDTRANGRLRPGESATPTQLVKNVFTPAPAFAPTGRLIVNSQVRDLLTHFAKVSFVPAQIAIAWHYPYQAGVFEYMTDSAYDERLDKLDYSGFIDKYRVDPPQVELFEVVDYGYQICHSDFKDNPGKYTDRRVYKVAPSMEGRSGAEVTVSRIMLEEVGLYRSAGFACAPGLLEMLDPFLHNDYFWRGRFSF